MKSLKDNSGMNWHDFIIEAVLDWKATEKEMKPGAFDGMDVNDWEGEDV